MQDGTLLFMAPEQLHGKYPIKQVKTRRFSESWYLAVGHSFSLFSQSRIKCSVWYWVRQNDRYTWISRGVYCKLSRCWQFARNVGLILFLAADILETSIQGTSSLLAGESGISTLIEGCKGLYWKTQLTIKNTSHSAWNLWYKDCNWWSLEQKSAARKW